MAQRERWLDTLHLDPLRQLPELATDEVAVQSWKDCELRGANIKECGTVMVTSLRILFWARGCELGRQIRLGSVSQCLLKKKKRGKMLRGAEWEVELWEAASGSAATWIKPTGHAAEIVRCIDGALEQYFVKQRAKERLTCFSASSAGIGGILRKERRKREQAGQLAAEVQSDLNNLIRHAADVADMLKRYHARQGGQVSTSALRSLGAGVWAAGTDGDQEVLARRVGAFCVTAYFPWLDDPDQAADPIQCAAAMVSLPDVYCQFSRARGLASLVSPEELTSSLEVFLDPKSANYLPEMPVELRTFPSGVKVVRPSKRADSALQRAIAGLARNLFGIGEIEAATHLGIPAALARLHLLDAEKNSILCRDDSPAGLRFFRNVFVHPPPEAYLRAP